MIYFYGISVFGTCYSLLHCKILCESWWGHWRHWIQHILNWTYSSTVPWNPSTCCRSFCWSLSVPSCLTPSFGFDGYQCLLHFMLYVTYLDSYNFTEFWLRHLGVVTDDCCFSPMMVLGGLEPEILAIIVSGVVHFGKWTQSLLRDKTAMALYPKIFTRACPNKL